MKRESWQVVLSCVISSGIGSLIALDIYHPLWWIGLVVGFVIGYLIIDPVGVIRAIPSAWHAARNWKTPRFFWASWIWTMAFFDTLFFYVALYFCAMGLLHQNFQLIFDSLKMIALVIITLVPIVSLLFNWIIIIDPSEGLRVRVRNIKYCRQWVSFLAPHRVFFIHLPRAIWWIVCQIPKQISGIASFSRRFGWELFIRIHSDKRLLCGTDALLGTAVGYFTGSAVIGAIAGGLFGLVNYEIVTERWLKPRGYVTVRS